MDTIIGAAQKNRTESPMGNSDWISELKRRGDEYISIIGGEIRQEKREANFFYFNMKMVNPQVYVEIGSYTGGSLYCFAGACMEKAKVIAIDDNGAWEQAKRGDRLSRTVDELKKSGYDASLIWGDSRSRAVMDRLNEILAEDPIDVLFIDGAHSYEGFRSDFANYAPLVRRGGIIGCHDIYPRQVGVWRAWEEIKRGHRTAEIRGLKSGNKIFNPSPFKGRRPGIGIVYV